MTWGIKCISKRRAVKRKNTKNLICNEKLLISYEICHYHYFHHSYETDVSNVAFLAFFSLEYTYSSYPIAPTINTLKTDKDITHIRLSDVF
jgi:hypothetical protein